MPIPLESLAAQITVDGVTAPSYPDVLDTLKAKMRAIFGDDVYLEPDSQDGQLLAIVAKAITDCNLASVAAYNSFSPQTAVGVGLSSVVKINHIQRQVPTNSEVNLTLSGVAGTIINNGIAGDNVGNRWKLPASVTIGVSGSVIVTAVAEVAGATNAPVGSVNQILTPTAGWQAVTNATAASVGNAVETDAQLRRRQSNAPAKNAVLLLQSFKASIQALPGVTYAEVYENDTGAVDANGLPAHSVAVVVEGGVAADIVDTIYKKKHPGVVTHGTTTLPVVDVAGNPHDINFFVLALVPIKVSVSLVAGIGYNANIAATIKQAVADYINASGANEDLVVSRLYGPALLNGAAESLSYKLTALTAALHPSGTLGTSDIAIGISERASCDPANVTITLV